MLKNDCPAGTADDSSTTAEVTTSSPNIAKPHVGCCTSLAETAIQQARTRLNNSIKDLIESNATANFKIINALEEVDMMLCKLLQVEKNNIIDAYSNGIIYANYSSVPLDELENASKEYFNTTFKK